ncbi:heterokaryon incompatibility protein-domain-containing protein [Sordaria brevicollis]|uniref:Heterokaryon incompatibility protein-domain-containing protein n=1 Tax=Sordaria brevicollis TaxID=83679 RepID=A0AAE0PLX3_SORBR|nr:heterokaryon incompatibility protein-domain-containing protein [Sordaria brevicollis]
MWTPPTSIDRKSWEDAWIRYGPDKISEAVSVSRWRIYQPVDDYLSKSEYVVEPILLTYLPPNTPHTGLAVSRANFLLEPSRIYHFRAVFSKCPRLGPTTASSLDLAKIWLDNCVAGHPRCWPMGVTSLSPPKSNIGARMLEKVTWVPTRLLHLTEKTVQLIETKETRPLTPYVTVTHRWGFADEEKMKLNKKKNYPSLKKGVPFSSMPRLFQNVISIALHLGINYIWIDSFCILQDKDDQTDWRREATQMQQVYANSFCNTSADDATSCSDTLFSEPRDPEEEIMPQHFNFPSEHAEKLGTAQSFTITSLNAWETQVTDALVNTRGWVLQERVLSRRIVHFGRRQIFWKCNSIEACEAIPLPLNSSVVHTQGFLVNGARFKKSEDLASGRRPENPYRIWHNLVQIYTRTELSNPSDKLVAISGLAKLFQDWTGDDYLAGLWRRNFECWLLWYNNNDNNFQHQRKP